MALDREAIWSALFTRIRDNTPSVRTHSRKRRAQWGLEEYPVLMLLDDSGDETPRTERDAPGVVWNLTGEIVILSRPVDIDDAPTATVNALVTETLTAIEREASDPVGGPSYGGGYTQTYTNLGGLIRVLSVTKVEKGSGEIAGQAVAKLSIEMDAL